MYYHLVMSSASDLPYLIKLLDDNDPQVRPVVRQQLAGFDGDVSRDLEALGLSLSEKRMRQLSRCLAPARRQSLMDQWISPSCGLAALDEDWDSFEHFIHLLSDFLHDGVHVRKNLADGLDQLEDEFRREVPNPNADDLRRWLFVEGPYRGCRKDPREIGHYDLGCVMGKHEGNAISLGVLFMLLGHRFGLGIDGCCYPGQFLCRVEIGGVMYAVDCFHQGRIFEVDSFIQEHPEISSKASLSLQRTCFLGDVLKRMLNEMQLSLSVAGREEDALLVQKLMQTL